jgi:hypothetical protein
VKAYAALANGSQLDLSPLDVQATSDGGAIALAETQSSQGLGVDWLVKVTAAGAPQWQEQVGCASPQGAPGDYADGVSVQQTSDGGYVVAGGTIDCGSVTSCPPLSGRSCALVEKLDAAGKLTWARAYQAGFAGSDISQIRQTTDGGYIAAGSFTDASQNTGALLLKLDSAGNVQWQQDLGPAGSTTQAYFNTVQQTADGGYVAAGAYYTPTSGPAPTQVLVARFGADGSLAWQHGFATLGGSGAPTSVADASSIIQTSDGGYAVAGRWGNSTFADDQLIPYGGGHVIPHPALGVDSAVAVLFSSTLAGSLVAWAPGSPDAPRAGLGQAGPARFSCLQGPQGSPGVKAGPQGRRRRRCASSLEAGGAAPYPGRGASPGPERGSSFQG